MTKKGEKGKASVPPKPPAQPPVLNPISQNAPHGADAKVTLDGEQFTKDAVASAGATKLETKWLSDRQIEVVVPAALIPTAGMTLQITVQTEGGTSASRTLTTS